MKLATTTGDFNYFCKTYEEKIQHLYDAGFRYIDLCMCTIRENDALLVAEDWRENAKRLKEFANKLGMQFVQAHAPCGNLLRNTGDDRPKFERLFNATVRSIEVCGELGIPNIVVHLGCRKDLDKAGFFEENRKVYEMLFPVMEKNNVNVLCENSMKGPDGCSTYYYTNTGAEMKEFVEYVNHPLIHACWDTGHGNLEGTQYDNIMALGKDLYAVHINDNHGERDEHIMPFLGTLNMDEVMCALIDVEFQGYFTLEAGSSYFFPLRNKREFERDKRLALPQLDMQKNLEKCMYENMVYVLKTYDSFEK